MTITPSRPARPVLDLLQTTADLEEVRRAAAEFDLSADERQWKHLGQVDNGGDPVDLWLISWPGGTSTGWHDHGTAEGGFAVLRGTLTERSWQGGIHTRTLDEGEGRGFGSHHIHDVINHSSGLAVSLHGYSPRLTMMTRYSVHSEGIQIIGVDRAGTW